jgi:hypothetical protein
MSAAGKGIENHSSADNEIIIRGACEASPGPSAIHATQRRQSSKST